MISYWTTEFNYILGSMEKKEKLFPDSNFLNDFFQN